MGKCESCAFYSYDEAYDDYNYIAMIKEFVKVDELTFEIYLTQGNVDFNYTLAANSLAILSKEAPSRPRPRRLSRGWCGPPATRTPGCAGTDGWSSPSE